MYFSILPNTFCPTWQCRYQYVKGLACRSLPHQHVCHIPSYKICIDLPPLWSDLTRGKTKPQRHISVPSCDCVIVLFGVSLSFAFGIHNKQNLGIFRPLFPWAQGAEQDPLHCSLTALLSIACTLRALEGWKIKWSMHANKLPRTLPGFGPLQMYYSYKKKFSCTVTAKSFTFHITRQHRMLRNWEIKRTVASR